MRPSYMRSIDTHMSRPCQHRLRGDPGPEYDVSHESITSEPLFVAPLSSISVYTNPEPVHIVSHSVFVYASLWILSPLQSTRRLTHSSALERVLPAYTPHPSRGGVVSQSLRPWTPSRCVLCIRRAVRRVLSQHCRRQVSRTTRHRTCEAHGETPPYAPLPSLSDYPRYGGLFSLCSRTAVSRGWFTPRGL